VQFLLDALGEEAKGKEVGLGGDGRCACVVGCRVHVAVFGARVQCNAVQGHTCVCLGNLRGYVCCLEWWGAGGRAWGPWHE
jgi:hypothetical protein